MLKLTKVIVTFVMLLLMSSAVYADGTFAAHGSALVPNIFSIYQGDKNYVTPYITLTNITDQTIECQIHLYDSEGTDITQYGSVYKKGMNNFELISTGTEPFEIPAHGTRTFRHFLKPVRESTMGHAIVEWKSSDSRLRKALIGGLRTHGIMGASVYASSSPINNGQPF